MTYAADWSEYHHTDGGWYNLDPLWASDAIDVIGIDAYFPITDSTSSSIPSEDIDKGWTSGEGYDFYRDRSDKNALSPTWAWKNIEYWWSHTHTNPDGKTTNWKPKSKKIWFTEFGFPSIDKSPNQPNVFYDPKCSDGGAPRHSTSQIDFSIQRKAIKVSIEHFKSSEFVEKMFLWTWDARPYPAWPHGNSWRDGNLWSRGHWVCNKFGTATLGAILTELCAKAGISPECVDIGSVDEVVGGIILDQNISIWDAINMLRYAYLFDVIVCKAGVIKFIKRGTAAPKIISKKDLIKLNDYSFLFCSKIPDSKTLSRVLIRFTERSNYISKTYYKNLDKISYITTQNLHLPITMSACEASVIATNLIELSGQEKAVFKLSLPITYIYLEPTDVLKLGHDHIRITSIEIKGLVMKITGVSC
ncbi:MAG: glycoside hydrolase TIM-barrel-like domain-containing protein [Pseudomonadota bacterium]